ncbi:MAG TPA: polyprenyl diphosphate synthase [bacterium]|nr:polyprenyl diphosphate synthase [bacterium]
MRLKHIAIIMDGNGRWAKRRGLPRAQGHRAGSETARKISRAVFELKIPYLTLYALSTENLYRPQAELDALIGLMRNYLATEASAFIENRIRLQVIGDRAPLPADLRRTIAQVERDTARDYRGTLILAICYGGRDEIVRAVKSLAQKDSVKNVTEARLSAALDTAGMPDPDLVIRTGGDHRVSNFLIWEAAYAELYFTRVLWPDFSVRHLKSAIKSFHERERRFGRTDDAVSSGPGRGRRKKGKLR